MNDEANELSGVHRVLRREADLITVTDKADLQHAMNDAMEAAERSASLPGHGTRGLPLQSLLAGHPVKLQLVRCKEVRPKPLSVALCPMQVSLFMMRWEKFDAWFHWRDACDPNAIKVDVEQKLNSVAVDLDSCCR